MSYCITDRHGGFAPKYMPVSGSAGTGNTWWPDFGPTTRAFSNAQRSHPTDTIYENCIKPLNRTASSPSMAPGARGAPEPPQFRNPEPSRKAIYSKDRGRYTETPTTTMRDVSLQRIELKQQRIDAWLGDPPISYGAMHGAPGPKEVHAEKVLQRSRSAAAALGSAAAPEVHRDVYEKQGFLVGRHKPSIADGSGTVLDKVRKGHHKTLSRQQLGLNHELINGPRQRSKNTAAWVTTKAMIAAADALVLSKLPPVRGGPAHPKEWPGLQVRGMREFRAPINCGETMPAAILDQ